MTRQVDGQHAAALGLCSAQPVRLVTLDRGEKMNEHQIATIIAYDKSARQYSEKPLFGLSEAAWPGQF